MADAWNPNTGESIASADIAELLAAANATAVVPEATEPKRNALSIKDAGGHMLSFDHVVQTYFMIHGPSTRDDIVQWISNNWQTYFGSWERLSIHNQLTKALELGPYKTIRDGMTVKWARQDS